MESLNKTTEFNNFETRYQIITKELKELQEKTRKTYDEVRELGESACKFFPMKKGDIFLFENQSYTFIECHSSGLTETGVFFKLKLSIVEHHGWCVPLGEIHRNTSILRDLDLENLDKIIVIHRESEEAL